VKAARVPDCHPDRKYHARGLCLACYRAQPDVRERREYQARPNVRERKLESQREYNARPDVREAA
jgi:hypothetical protein